MGNLSTFFTTGMQSVAVGGLQNRCSNRREDPSFTFSHGKKVYTDVYTDYSITDIRGDGRCLFRSVAHGARLRSGNPAPNESLERALADDLRAKVADEFLKRRASVWFLEEDLDIHVSQMRDPNAWGGEPELFMASHVLQMPITVFIHDGDSTGLITIAEYGQEYGKENPSKYYIEALAIMTCCRFQGSRVPHKTLVVIIYPQGKIEASNGSSTCVLN